MSSSSSPTQLLPQTNPVLIVGAGPTGLTAALELSRLGVPVRLIDQHAGPATTSRAIAVHARTLELLAPRGVADEMLHLGNQTRFTSIYGATKRLAQLNLQDIPSRYNFVLMLAQSETERLLREQVARQGVAVEWETTLAGLLQTDAQVQAVLRLPSGQLEEVALAYLISAEGAHSLVRHTLGLPFAGRSLPQRYALADLYLDSNLPSDEMSIFLGNEGLMTVFPLADQRFRLIVSEPDGPDAPPTLAELQHLYDAHASQSQPARLRDVVWTSRFRINSRMVERLRVGRIFLGGDAAHVHSPVGGQGMNTGIQDMINISWKLAAVWHGQAAAELLDTYEQDRLPVIKEVVGTTERATDVITTSGPLVHKMLTHALPLLLGSNLVQHKGTQVISQVASHYRASDLSLTRHAGGHLHGGDRLPDLDVQDATGKTGPLYAQLDPSRLTLLLATSSAPTPQTPTQAAQLQPWQAALQIRAVAPAAGTASGWAEAVGTAPALLLVRPDAYLAVVARADTDGWAALLAWLHRWLPVQATQDAVK